MIGILTEKPSAGRNFAKALGGMQGSYNGEQYLIVSSRGHLFEFDQPENLVPRNLADRYKSWDLANLPWDESIFSWKRVQRGDVSSTLASIQQGLSGCDEIVIATDVDPSGEGELLAWEILDELKLRPKKWSRMYFTDEAPASLQKAFASRKPIVSMMQDMDFVKADYRSKFDFLTMQFTRIASKNGDGHTMLRQGRLKSAMVLIVGDQLAKVAAYKKVPFYQNKFRDDHGVVYTDPNAQTYPDKSQVPGGLHQSAVVCDSKQMKTQAPPKMLDLATMSARLSAQGFKAKQVLDTYQRMYEAQVVSYPRTEDKVITPEQFKELLPLIDKIAALVGVDPAVLTHRTPRPTHVKTGGAHGANRPGTNVPGTMAGLDQYDSAGSKGLAQAIYTMLARNYLATLAEDYQYEAQAGHVKDYPAFKGSASVPKVPGWKAVFDDDSGDDADNVTAGLGTIADPFIHEGFPPKPTAPTMRWLMKELEKYDVGTGATRTTIYADVTSDKPPERQLLIEKKGKLTMARAGEMSYKLLPGTHIGDLKLTEALQADMRAIVEGKADPAKLLSRVQEMVRHDLKTMALNAPQMRADLNIQAPEYVEGVWNGKPVRFKKSWSGHVFTDQEIADLLAGKEIKLMGVIGRSGTPFNVKGKLANQVFSGKKFVGFESTGFLNDDGTDRAQSQAASGDYCEGTWKGKKIKFKKSWGGHAFTDQECQTLLAGGEVSFPAKSKAGTDYTAVGKLAEQTWQGRKFVGFKPDFGNR